MKQFYTIKGRHPDAILFFQMGDFYETFGDDAEVVSRELDITLTSRGRTADGERMPLAGVPVHAGETYISRLVQKGYRVAVCDQVEDPRIARGVVKREVVRIITPGTLIDAGMLHSSKPRYLMAIAPDLKNAKYGLAFLDLSTGEFFVTECSSSGGTAELFSEISRSLPCECIIPREITGDIIAFLTQRGIVVTPYTDDAFSLDEARKTLMDQFKVQSLAGYGCEDMPASIRAAGATLHYARETQNSRLDYINGLATRHSSRHLVLDAITMRNLEVLQNIRTGGENSTLLGILDQANTPMGSRMLRSFLTRPLVDREEIEARLDAVEYFIDHSMVRAGLRAQFHRFADLERIAARIAYGNAGPRDLITLKHSLGKISQIQDIFRDQDKELPALIGEAISGIEPMEETADLIGRALVEEPPAQAKAGGMIRKGFDRRLDKLRFTARDAKTWIAEFQQKERERTGIKSLKIGYNKVFGYYIEVTKANISRVPPEYQRKQTLVNGERYTIPQLQEKEALISTAEDRESALEQELFTGLLNQLADTVPVLQANARNIGLLDVYTTLAVIAQKNRYVRPRLEESERLIIRDGRHPVVEQNLPFSFVPNDTELDSRTEQILIITGANMAGKSTYMRGVALICILAQMGSFVPATHATIGIVDRIFTRVGAFDDLASGQSTFMVEMLELANILNNVTKRSLVILDEIGRGTSTLDGFSIAKAVLEYLHGNGPAGPRTLFATHFHEIVHVETDLKRVKNCHFAVKDSGREVVFLRKIIPGATDRSYGIHVALLAGIPQKVTNRAEEILVETMRREYQGDGRKVPRYTQMLLIDTPDSEKREHPVIGQLKNLDLNTMTPLDALVMLHDLKRKTRDGEG